MEMLLNSIDFNRSGYGAGSVITGANINFTTVGGTYAINGYISITLDEFLQAEGNPDSVIAILKEKIKEDLDKVEEPPTESEPSNPESSM